MTLAIKSFLTRFKTSTMLSKHTYLNLFKYTAFILASVPVLYYLKLVYIPKHTNNSHNKGRQTQPLDKVEQYLQERLNKIKSSCGDVCKTNVDVRVNGMKNRVCL